MTISSTTSRKTYAGDGVTTSFATNPVVFYTAADLVVQVTNNTTGAVTALTLNMHYTVSGGGTTPATGTVNLAGGSSPYGAVPSGSTLVFYRDVAITQQTDYVQNNPSDAEVTEATIDKLTMISQRLSDRVGRSVRLPDGDATGATMVVPALASRASKVFGFDAAGEVTTYTASSAVTTADNVTFVQSGSGAVPTDLQSRGRLVVHVFDYMSATEKANALAFSAATDVRASIQKAIDAVVAAGGGDIITGPYPFLIGSTTSPDTMANGLVIPYSADELNGGGTAKRVRLICTPQTRFLAGNNNMIVIRFSDSLGAILGFPSIEANGHTGVWGVGLVPQDMAQTTTCVFQCYNKLEIVTRGIDEGLVIKGGPTVTGRDSGCWYNEIYHFHFGGLRGRWLRPPANGTSIVNNRNIFRGRVGGGCNVGTYIQSGTTNKDYTNYEGVNSGTSPEATPTGVIIRTASDNADNEIYGLFESCTRSIENAANSTKVYSPLLDLTTCLFTVRPIMFMTRDATTTKAYFETGSIGIAGSAANPPVANTLYKDNVVKAWVKFDGRAGNGIVAAYNLTNWVRNSIGNYTLNFVTQLAGVHHCIVGTADSAIVYWNAASATQIGVITKDDAGNLVDPVRVSLIVMGGQ